MQYIAVVYSHKRIKLDELYKYDIDESLLKKSSCEYAILRTCNRIELYLADKESKEKIELIAKDISSENAEIYSGKDAVTHLFSVSSGLESMILGENEILGQVKNSYEYYKSNGQAGEGLSSLFKSAVKVGKKVRNETNINKGKIGIYSLAIDYIKQHYNNEEIAIIGSGEEAHRFLNGLSKTIKPKGKIFSRTIENAEKLANKYSMDYGIFNIDEIKSYSVIFCAYKGKERIEAKNNSIVIDISIPRVFYGENVVYIDDLVNKSKENLKLREYESKKAREIIERSVTSFMERNH